MVAVLIWIMIYPMMVQVDFASIRSIGADPVDHHSGGQLVDQAFHNDAGLAFAGLFADPVDPQTPENTSPA